MSTQGKDRVRARALAWALVLSGQTLLGAVHAQGGQAADGTSGERSFLALEGALQGPRDPQELRRRLGDLDSSQIPGLFQLSAEGRLSGGTSGAIEPLTQAERRILRESLAARPRRELMPFLVELSSRPQVEPLRLEAQSLLAVVGTGDHLKILARLTLSPQERGTVSPALRAGFAAATKAILQRDGAAIAEVPFLFSESPPGLASSIIDALASQPSPTATATLAALLGRSPGLDPLLLARLGERRALPENAERDVFVNVRRYLKQRDAALVSAAALASGKLGDDGAVEFLIGLIEHADERVRENAYEALRRISGLAFGAEPARWTSWYNSETRWWDEEAAFLLVRIERGHGLEFVRACGEVLKHRLYRDRIAETFTHALQRAEAEEVRLACRALEQLGSSVAVNALIECLDRNEPGVRDAAWKALRAITGADLPPEASAWLELAG